MTKTTLLELVRKYVPNGIPVVVCTQHPTYSWQTTWRIYLSTSVACFTSAVRGNKPSTSVTIGWARGQRSAEKQAAKYTRWLSAIQFQSQATRIDEQPTAASEPQEDGL